MIASLRSHKEYIQFVNKHLQTVQIPKAHEKVVMKLKLLDLTPLRLLFLPMYCTNIVVNLRRNSPQIHADFVTQMSADRTGKKVRRAGALEGRMAHRFTQTSALENGRSAKISVGISVNQRAILQDIFS